MAIISHLKTFKLKRLLIKDHLARCSLLFKSQQVKCMQWRELIRTYLLTRIKFKIPRMKRKYCSSQIIPLYCQWTMCSKMNTEFTSSLNTSEVVISMIICMQTRDSQRKQWSSLLLKLHVLLDIFIRMESCTEIWNQKMYCLMSQATFTWQILDFQNSFKDKMIRLTVSVAQPSIWPQKFWTWRVMGSQLTGGQWES